MTLFCVCVHASRITWRGGVPKVEPGVSVGPLASETLAEVEQYARARAGRLFPAYKGWTDHAYTIAETPEALVRQVATAEPTLERKQRRRERERAAKQAREGTETGNQPDCLVSQQPHTKIALGAACDNAEGLTTEAERSLV